MKIQNQNNYFNNDYRALEEHFRSLQNSDFYKILCSRNNVEEFTADSDHLVLDYNRNLITNETLLLLEKFLESKKFAEFRDKLFNSGITNITENKSADHIALRNIENDLFNGNKILIEGIKNSLKKIQDITKIVHSKQPSATIIGDIRHVVHIGIGGSDLGPRLVVDALDEFRSESAPEIHFINNVDPYQINRVFKKIDASKTLFVVVSKSFKTPEILLIAKIIKDKFSGDGLELANRVLAVTSNPDASKILNVHPDNCLYMPDTIGGRFSLWSPTGLTISLFTGYEKFLELLQGASSMDRHFRFTPVQQNIPVLLAMLEFWYVNFYRSEFSTVNPYTERLQLLPFFLQQLQMESNGKSTDIYGNPISYVTAPVIMGGTGTPCQHSYFQALHQGKHIFHAEFVGILRAPDQEQNQSCYDFLFSSMLAQTHTLLSGYASSDNEVVPQHKIISGNKPCNLLLMKKWTPASLGSLLAAYEHKTAVLGLLWQIDSFDQWGVERGKKICAEIGNYINGKSKPDAFIDPANEFDIKLYRQNQ